MKRILVFLMTLSLLYAVPLTAYAHDVPQDRNDCSIEVIVRFDGENVDGGTLTTIKVGYVDSDDGNYFFRQVITDEKLEDIASPAASRSQKAFYENFRDRFPFETQTQSVRNGKATFRGLSTGLYLIIQEEAAEGFSELGAFLVSVPYMEDGEYNYHVTAAIKSEQEREPEATEPPPTKPDDSKLPQTGQLNWPIPMLLAAGLAFLTVGWVLIFGKKREQHEN